MQALVDIVKGLAHFLANTLKTHWTKMLFSMGCAIVFFVLLFPYSDMTSFATKFIFEQTSISTHIRTLGINIFPFPGVKIEGLDVNIADPPLSISQANFYPSLFSSLFHSGFYFSGSIDDILDGNLNFSLSAGDKVPDKENIRQVIDFNIEKVQISKLLAFLKTNTFSPIQLPMSLEGFVSMTTKVDVDPELNVQPSSEFEITGENIKFPAQSFPTMMGPLNFPEMTWKTVFIKGRLIGGELILEEVNLGQPGDPFIIKSKGKFSLRFRKTPAGIISQTGTYEIDNDWLMSQGVQDRVGILLSPIAGDYRTSTSSGTRYLFRAIGQNTGSLPRTQAIRSL